MKGQRLALDRISSLPPNIIQHILTLMPIRDAFRTSILSHNWRYHCQYIPKLRFDQQWRSAYKTLSAKCKLLHIVYPILLLHQVPILEFALSLNGSETCCEIDQIILHLSRKATLKEFSLTFWSSGEYKLLPPFFNLQQLTVLKLHNCAFRPPETFSGFSRLVKLLFNKVSITAKDFLRLISNCPLLEDLAMIGDENHLLGCWNSNFVELFERLPLLKHLLMSAYPIKCFVTGFMPKKLPTSLVHLEYLHLHRLRYGREVDLLSALSLVASFNVEITEIEMEDNPTEAMSQSDMNLIDHYHSFVILDHLRVIKIRNFTNIKIGMDFVKFILAKSPMLKKVVIYINHEVDVHGELKIVKELIRYPRASAKAEIMINKERHMIDTQG